MWLQILCIKQLSCYHAAIKKVCSDKVNIVNDHFAAALLVTRNHNFWQEVKRIRSRKTAITTAVDGLSSANDIVDMFASKFHDLHTSASYGMDEMHSLCAELREFITSPQSNLRRACCIVRFKIDPRPTSRHVYVDAEW